MRSRSQPRLEGLRRKGPPNSWLSRCHSGHGSVSLSTAGEPAWVRAITICQFNQGVDVIRGEGRRVWKSTFAPIFQHVSPATVPFLAPRGIPPKWTGNPAEMGEKLALRAGYAARWGGGCAPLTVALGSAILASDAATRQMRWAPRGTPYSLNPSLEDRHPRASHRRSAPPWPGGAPYTLRYIKQPS